MEGRSTYRVLREAYPSTSILVLDQSTQIQIAEHTHTSLSLGDAYMSRIAECDIVLRSPGIKLSGSLYTGRVTSQLEIFTQLHRSRIIGVTGTKGKSTTTSLIHHLLTGSHKTALVGNIGIPAFDTWGEEYDYYVCEYSCHQLSDMSVSPSTAVLLNLYPEHLDYYDSVADYYATKLRIFQYQQPGDSLYTTAQVTTVTNLLPQHAVVVGADQELPHSTSLPGEHNKLNQHIAATVAGLVGVGASQIVARLSTFVGLPHRLELVHKTATVQYINDSISTTPQSTIAGLQAYSDVAAVLIGGYDRGIDYTMLVDYLRQHAESFDVILFSEVGRRLGPQLGLPVHSTFELAMQHMLITNYSGTVLMSPAAASYDEFSSFVERGQVFKEIINSHYQTVK